jgi:hypothetical protein
MWTDDKAAKPGELRLFCDARPPIMKTKRLYLRAPMMITHIQNTNHGHEPNSSLTMDSLLRLSIPNMALRPFATFQYVLLHRI